MKVTLFTGMFREKADGVARTLLKLSETFTNQKIDHWVFSPVHGDAKSDFLKSVQVPSFPSPGYPEYRISTCSYRWLAQKLDEIKPDIIEISTPDWLGYCALKYALKNNIPTVGVYHTHFPSYFSFYNIGFLEPLAWKYLKWFYNTCTHVLAPTQSMIELLKENGVQTPMTMWSRGIEANLFNPSRNNMNLREEWGGNERIYVTFLGRMVWYKGLDLVRDVSEKLYRNYPDLASKIVFVFAGDGPARKEVEKQMPAALFLGHVSKERVGEVLASSDILFFPSATETFGQAVMESLACGLPAIVSDKGGPAEIVSEAKAGLICKANDVESFLSGLVKLIQEPETRSLFKHNALSFTHHRSWTAVNQIVIDTFKKIQ